MAQGKDQIRKFLFFSAQPSVPCTLRRKACHRSPASLIFFMLLPEGVWNRATAATFSRNGLKMLVICCVRNQTLMPTWRAERPRETSWPARPFTSFKAAQSSKTISVLTLFPEKIAAHFKPRFDLLLRAVNDKNAPIVINNSVGFVVVFDFTKLEMKLDETKIRVVSFGPKGGELDIFNKDDSGLLNHSQIDSKVLSAEGEDIIAEDNKSIRQKRQRL